ncbi:HopJ type III effector protein [Vibrio pectenicida]|uniref:Type III effector n=1 Tax=Vibrio pectenicida TaxID=62763 RepID=A0A3R9EGR8_9VIBR|nr:HopJ type III effector protein [Vibrio pectenicida]RSD30079.1 type III effector [Vibrio pectenicida]
MDKFLKRLTTAPNDVMFEQSIQLIDEHFDFHPVNFVNGVTQNQAGKNNGSCKIFAFAQMQGLDESSTLACFGQFYRDDVLNNPNGCDHANIRNFIQHGWAGIHFDGVALTEK